MLTEISLIFPHQLYKNNPAILPNRTSYLVEEWLYFKQYAFHKQKLVLHRASMKFYEAYLQEQNMDVVYVEASESTSDIRQLMKLLSERGINTIHYTDTTDKWLEQRLISSAKKYGMELVQHITPNFLNTMDDVNPFFNNRKTYFQTDFYNWQRKKRQILMQPNGEPEGGRFSFDHDNRKPIKKGELLPAVSFPAENVFVKNAREHVAATYDKNYGSLRFPGLFNDGFYPTTFEEAETWLDQFLEERFDKFGVFEDAIVADEHYLFHSALTPMLNTGLLNPDDVIKKTISKVAELNIPMNSLEGFIRQIMGWREFIRIVYEREGTRQRNKNYWGFTRQIPESFWTATTGIVPVDSVVSKLLNVGYSHHIERLMVMGNFMLLCEFDPNAVYDWFMELYIDAYDWVMVPNTYGMTQFADGGLMTTKPYISGSNYLMKMSNYKKGPWQNIWDGLFWRFMHVHRDLLSKNMRIGMLIKTFDKMPVEKQQSHLHYANDFLLSLDIQNDSKA